MINTSTSAPTLNILNGLTFSSAISETGNNASAFGDVEFVEIKLLNIATIGNLKPLNIVTIDENTNVANLNIDWQGVSYVNNVMQAIDIINKKVLTLTMTNDLNDDAFVSYFEDANTYNFTLYYIKYL